MSELRYLIVTANNARHIIGKDEETQLRCWNNGFVSGGCFVIAKTNFLDALQSSSHSILARAWAIFDASIHICIYFRFSVVIGLRFVSKSRRGRLSRATTIARIRNERHKLFFFFFYCERNVKCYSEEFQDSVVRTHAYKNMYQVSNTSRFRHFLNSLSLSWWINPRASVYARREIVKDSVTKPRAKFETNFFRLINVSHASRKTPTSIPDVKKKIKTFVKLTLFSSRVTCLCNSVTSSALFYCSRTAPVR